LQFSVQKLNAIKSTLEIPPNIPFAPNMALKSRLRALNWSKFAPSNNSRRDLHRTLLIIFLLNPGPDHPFATNAMSRRLTPSQCQLQPRLPAAAPPHACHRHELMTRRTHTHAAHHNTACENNTEFQYYKVASTPLFHLIFLRGVRRSMCARVIVCALGAACLCSTSLGLDAESVGTPLEF
jgi:hypothetical protein